jgi:hypothetical protein
MLVDARLYSPDRLLLSITRDTPVQTSSNTKRIGILVVHGIGEQTAFDHLQDIAGNLFLALRREPERRAHIQIRRGDQVPLHSPTESWRETPVIVSWWSPAMQRQVEAHFKEVHWADLDMPATFWNWLELAGWALGMSGVRLFTHSKIWAGRQPFMHLPRELTQWELIKVGAQLFGLSLLFLFMLTSIGLLDLLTFRRVPLFKKLFGVIYDYLGDVKLYQDWFVREDSNLETIGDRSRVAIRRRMVRALLHTAAEVEAGRIDEYYILAHSLGTVVAFNALMELDLTLPNYLTREEWDGLPDALKALRQDRIAPEKEQPQRPPWLSRQTAVNRTRLFARLRGVLTMGSPLDKFAALWRIIVPVNNEPIPVEVEWANVADCQDMVAGTIDLYSGNANVGGLRLRNIEWTDQPWLLTAHTSYWKAGRGEGRLINRLIGWLEREGRTRDDVLAAPTDSCPRWLAKSVYAVSLLALSCGGLVATSAIVREALKRLFSITIAEFPPVLFLSSLLSLPVEEWAFLLLMLAILGFGTTVVAAFSIVRYVGELLTINPIRRGDAPAASGVRTSKGGP